MIHWTGFDTAPSLLSVPGLLVLPTPGGSTFGWRGGVSSVAVWFACSENSEREHPRQHPKNFKGGLHLDAYARFHHLYGNDAIYEVACWAHARRKFHEIHVIHASPTTTATLAKIVGIVSYAYLGKLAFEKAIFVPTSRSV